LSNSPLGFESSLVSQYSNPYLVDTTVVPIQYLVDTTLILGGDESLDHVLSHHLQPTVLFRKSSADTTPICGGYLSLDHVVSHPIQPMVEEVVMSMQYSVDSTLIVESDKSKEVTLSMKYSVKPTLIFGGDAYFDHVLIISSHVPYEQGSIPLYLTTLPPNPRMVSFDWNDIVYDGSSASILSSSSWKVFGSPKLVSTTSVLSYFDRILA
jgi:hypothetical protein